MDSIAVAVPLEEERIENQGFFIVISPLSKRALEGCEGNGRGSSRFDDGMQTSV